MTVGVPVPAVAGSVSAGEPYATFHEAVSHEQRGDVLEIGVSLSGTDAATVRVAPGEKHSATVVVRDEDGDGRATVLLNTYDWTFRASDGDNLTVRGPPSGPLVPAGEYRSVVVRPGTDTDRNPTDIGTLVVDERSTDDLRTWVAPKSADLSNLSAVNAAKSSGNLTRTGTVTKNDTFVLELRASGLEGALVAQDGSNVTAEFFDTFEGDDAKFRVRQTNAGPEVRPAGIHFAADSARVVVDSVNDSYYVVTDLADANVTRGERTAEIRGGHEYEANVSVAESSSLTANGTESATTRFGVVESVAEISTVGERRELVEPAPSQTLYGRTSLPPGTAVTVEVAVMSNERQFLETVQVRNDSDGTGRFAATFDLSDVSDGTVFTVAVRAEAYPDLDFDETRIVVSEPTASAEFSTVKSPRVLVDATLSHGGFVAVHRGSADGPVLGATGYLDAGSDEKAYARFDSDLESNATLVAVAYRDTNRDGEFDPEGDEPYASEESVVADAVEFTVEETTTTIATTTSTRTPHETTDVGTAAEATERRTEATDLENEESLPGFGVGAVVVALFAVALLARER